VGDQFIYFANTLQTEAMIRPCLLLK